MRTIIRDTHKAGTNLSKAGITTARGALEASGLDWTVERAPLYTTGASASLERIAGMAAIVRRDTGAPLGVVGARYKPLSNAEAFDGFDALVEAGHCQWDAAGSTRGGTIVWARLRLPDLVVRADHGDTVERYLVLQNTHDGSGAVRIFLSNVRSLCSNMLASAWRNAETRYRIPHSASVAWRTQAAISTLSGALNVSHVDQDAFARMNTTGIGYNGFQDYLRTVFGAGPGESPMARQAEVLHSIGRGVDAGTIGTVWGAYNAATDAISHCAGRRPKDFEAFYLDTVSGTRAGMLARAHSAALELTA